MIRRSAVDFSKNYFKDNKDLICAEIGVQECLHAESILNNLHVGQLWLIDAYPEYVDNYITYTKENQLPYIKKAVDFLKIKDNFKRTMFIMQDSITASSLFEDHFFDFIYIDASHIYSEVKKDLDSWFKKIKLNGIFSGHDYHQNDVRKAVDEFIKNKPNYILTTFNDVANGDTDWIIRRNNE